MRSFVSFCRVMVWIILALTTAVQAAAVMGIFLGNSADLFNPVLLIIAVALMIVSVVLFFALPRGKLIPLLIAVAAAVFFVILALKLKDAFPVTVTATGNAGISLWRAIYRHMSPALIPLFMLPVWFEYHADRRAIALAEADQRTPTYFDTPDEDDAAPPKPKRSVRARMRKESEDNA